MNIFKRAGLFAAKAYANVPTELQRGLESAVFTGGGLAIGIGVQQYGNMPFAHTAAGAIVGAVVVTPLLRALQIWFLKRSAAADAASAAAEHPEAFAAGAKAQSVTPIAVTAYAAGAAAAAKETGETPTVAVVPTPATPAPTTDNSTPKQSK